MPIRVGTDLVSVDSVRRSMSTHGSRYLRRVYTEQEIADCRSDGEVDCQRLAARFAAKEATLKVLRPGADDAIPWPSIEVLRDPAGWTGLALSGTAADLAARSGVTDLALSLTHEDGLACAVVVAELRTPSP